MKQAKQVQKRRRRELRRPAGPRIYREKRTVGRMIHIYCRGRHKGANKREMVDAAGQALELCAECIELFQYSLKRLTFCRFGEEKTTCFNCSVHCYAPKRREEIRQVMRYSGPRMVLKHPILTLYHALDGRKKMD